VFLSFVSVSFFLSLFFSIFFNGILLLPPCFYNPFLPDAHSHTHTHISKSRVSCLNFLAVSLSLYLPILSPYLQDLLGVLV
jgi:hypothetical protein